MKALPLLRRKGRRENTGPKKRGGCSCSRVSSPGWSLEASHQTSQQGSNFIKPSIILLLKGKVDSMFFILDCTLFLLSLLTFQYSFPGDGFLLWLAGFFLWPLPICFWMLCAVSDSSSVQNHLFAYEESDLQKARLSFEDKWMLREKRQAMEFMTTAASINKQC